MEILTREDDLSYSYIKYIPNFLDIKTLITIKNELEKENYIGGETDYGTTIPRLQKWMHDENQPFSLLWNKQYPRWQPREYTPFIKELKENLFEFYASKYTLPIFIKKPRFNSALINVYNSGKHSISFHRDNLPEFGNDPTIMVLSFGEARDMEFRRVIYNPKNPKSMKMDKNNLHKNFTIKLEEGSLLIMGGSTQKYYAHGIQKSNTDKKRYSITFREHTSMKHNKSKI